MEVPVAPVNYPAWDADEILRRKYGFCVQYAVVLMQSAISLGHQSRFVFGHNPGGSYEAGPGLRDMVQRASQVDPFGRQRELALHRPQDQRCHQHVEVTTCWRNVLRGQPATLANRPQERQLSDAIAICFGDSMAPGALPAGSAAAYEARSEGGRYSVPTRWLCLSYLPRNNFYAHAYPQPITQGCSWDGRNTGGGRTR